jgi:diguanylate cyclase (GGDEF)-like protein
LTKRTVFVAAIVIASTLAAGAAPPAPLTTLDSVSRLSNAEAAKGIPVDLEATVTYFSRSHRTLDVQDGDTAIYVQLTKDTVLALGDRVRLRGTTLPSFLPILRASDVTVLRHGGLPKPIPASFDDLMGNKINCKYIRVRGVVRTSDLVSSAVDGSGQLQLLMDGGYIDIEVEIQDASLMRGLLDAEVEVTGVAGRIFDGKMQQTGAKIKVSSLAGIEVLKPAGTSPWSLPVTPLDAIMTGYHVRDLSTRLRVHGTITYYRPGAAVVLQSGAKSLWISTQSREPLRIGDVADATGFPDTHGSLLMLNHAEIHDSGVQAPISPQPATWSQLAFWGRSKLGGRQYDLVSIEGKLVTEARETAQDVYVLEADGRQFTAIYAHPLPPSPPPSMLPVPLGATIRVTGICMPVIDNPYNEEAPFDVLLRSFDDIAVVARPSLLNIRNLIRVIGLLLALVIAVGAASWAKERRSRRRIGTLAYVEQRRARILEAINHSKPLAEILERVTELVSVRLNGAPCWCEVADGATLGNRPVKLPSSSLRIVEHPIASRTGSTLGSVFAAFDAHTKGDVEEAAALAMAAELATLAIETSRLYTDLVHRSEFDLLTDVQNRFVMEKKLAAMIHAARQSAGVFGLIYIDLDQFKRVNDVYGHAVGDHYLQEVAQRMKRQLRPGDTLARLGGDEFAVLVPVVHSREEVEEIATRLEVCFHEPFVGEGYVLHGSASVGMALYPEDAETVETLLSAADAEMYAAKYTRVDKNRAPEAQPDGELTLQGKTSESNGEGFILKGFK